MATPQTRFSAHPVPATSLPGVAADVTQQLRAIEQAMRLLKHPRVLYSVRQTGVTSGAKQTFVVPAKTLEFDGQALRVKIYGHALSAAANLLLDLGATNLLTFAVANADLFSIDAIIRRTGAAAESFLGHIASQLSGAGVIFTAATENLLTPLNLSFYASAANTCTVDHMEVQAIPLV